MTLPLTPGFVDSALVGAIDATNFRSSRRTKNNDTPEVSNRNTHQQTAQRERSDGVPDIYRVERGEEYYEMNIPDTDTLQDLQRTEEVHGNRVHDWIAEGMPIEIMGRVSGMEAFRERQAERPPEIPTNIERQNNRSVQRSEKAAGNTSSAGETGVPEPVRDVISSSGQPLDTSIQRVMEDRMGDSLGDVRIHTGPQAAAACESINARAFTIGNHIAFNSGEYDPESPEGQHVLAHELAHVRQQTQGAVSMLPQEDVELEIDPDLQLEREAEETAQQVMEGGELGIQRLAGTEVHIQRRVDDGSRGKVTDTTALKSDLEVATASVKAAGKEFTKRFVPNELMSAYEAGKAEAENQANEGLKLNDLDVSAEWAAILENSPAQWKQQITQQAVKAAKAATGSGSSQADELGR